MIRKAFRMSVNPDQHEEYEKRHRPIWPELEEVLLTAGVQTYTIFLDKESSQLFAYVEFGSEEKWDAVAETEICCKWWKHMREIMPSNPDNSPVSLELKEVFHIDND